MFSMYSLIVVLYMDLFATVDDPIHDVREPAAFRSETFSGYKKTAVRDELVEGLKQGKVENACYWTAELVCSGAYVELWDILFWFVGKYLSIKQPLIASYMERRLAVFRTVVGEVGKLYDTILELRNNRVIRQLFAEMVCVIALAEKRPGTEEIRLKEEGLLDLTTRLKADRPDYISELGILRDEDPKELVIGLNELVYHLRRTGSALNACFWIEWILGYVELCRKRGEPLYAQLRTELTDVDKKWWKDPVWLVVEALQEVGCGVGVEAGRVIKSLSALFRSRFQGPGTTKKRKSLLVYAVLILTDRGVSWKHELLSEQGKEVCRVATENVGKIYLGIGESSVVKADAAMVSGMASGRKEEKRRNLVDSMRKWGLLSEMDAAL